MVFADWLGSSSVSVTIPSVRSYFTASVVVIRFSFLGPGRMSDALDDGGNAHAAADAQGRHAVALLATLQLVDEGAEDHRAGGAERVAHGDGAAVDVGLLVRVVVQVAHQLERDRSEGLVDLEEVDVLDGQPRLVEGLAAGGAGAGQHDGRLAADDGGRDDAGAWLEPVTLAGLLVAEHHQRGAVDDAGAVAGVVHVVDFL